MQISEEARVPFDYEREDVSRAVCELRPVVYREGSLFRCVLGPDLENSISGQGQTPDAAVEDWTNALQRRLRASASGEMDEVTQYAKDVLNTSVNDVW